MSLPPAMPTGGGKASPLTSAKNTTRSLSSAACSALSGCDSAARATSAKV